MFQLIIQYLNAIKEAKKLELKIKAARRIALIVSFFIVSFISIITFAFCLLFFSLALFHFLVNRFGSTEMAYFIVGGLNLILLLVVLLFHERLFTKPISKITNRLFE